MMRAPCSRPDGRVLALASLVALAGCTERSTFTVGGDCTYNSDCAAPLVCRINRCRVDCGNYRDCAAGLSCLNDPVTGLGGCQIDDEARCLIPSDCRAPLVCRFQTCTTECDGDEDCREGATCQVEADAGVCHEEFQDLCVYNSDCPDGFVCGAGQTCYVECFEDRDCAAPRHCDLAMNRCFWDGDAGTP